MRRHGALGEGRLDLLDCRRGRRQRSSGWREKVGSVVHEVLKSTPTRLGYFQAVLVSHSFRLHAIGQHRVHVSRNRAVARGPDVVLWHLKKELSPPVSSAVGRDLTTATSVELVLSKDHLISELRIQTYSVVPNEDVLGLEQLVGSRRFLRG